MTPSNCRSTREVMLPYLRGTLNRAELDELHDHLDNCDECAKLADKARAAWGFLKQIPWAEISHRADACKERVMQLHDEQALQRAKQEPAKTKPGGLMAAAAAKPEVSDAEEDHLAEDANAHFARARAAILRRDFEEATRILFWARFKLGPTDRATLLYYQILDNITAEEHPDDWAWVNLMLGEAWRRKSTGNRADNLRQAREHLAVALRHYRPDAQASLWALASENLGLTYGPGAEGDARRNFDMLTKHLQAALEVLDPRSVSDHVRVRCLLGQAWNLRSKGTERKDLLKAVEHYTLALRVPTAEGSSEERASILKLLENMKVYLQLVSGPIVNISALSPGVLEIWESPRPTTSGEETS